MTEQENVTKDNIISENGSVSETTTPEKEGQIKIPVKFNKESRELSLEEATTLAQKGLKFESIEKDYAALKELASHESKSVPAFIESLCARLGEEKMLSLTEKCGGDEALAEHILKLEGEQISCDGFEELALAFPEIKSKENLPPEVLEKAQLRGTLLLDEYLRYLLNQKRNALASSKKHREGEKSSTGSLLNNKDSHTSETEEFLKGLWK